MLPNFLIVGAQKAGTSTLTTMLSKHPEVFMYRRTEPHFFNDENWGEGIGWYEALFEKAEGYNAIGESSPSYAMAPDSREVPRRIHECLGDIRYLYILRHPIERMISHYRHAILYHWIPRECSFEQALKLAPGIKNCSRYFYQVEQFLPYTRREQWRVLILKELMKDPQAVMREVYRFLGVDDRVVIPLVAENVTDRKRRLPFWLHRTRVLRPVIHPWIWRWGKYIAHRYIGYRVKRPTVAPDVLARLIDEIKPDLQRLGEFCSRDFVAFWSLDTWIDSYRSAVRLREPPRRTEEEEDFESP